METISVVIVTHQSEQFIDEVLRSVMADPAGPDEIIVVDSGSTDGTRDVVARHDVTWVELGTNVGFAMGCHEGAARATGSVLVFLGHDTTPEAGWLPPLVTAATTQRVGAAMATIVDPDRPDTFNTSGGHLTYVGLAWLSDLGAPIPAGEPELVDVAFPSGSAMAMRAELWDEFGGFRPDFFMYHEDSDLGWRLRLADLRVVRASRSRVRHDYDFSRSPRKMYHLERNRWTMLATNYHPATLAVLSPALIATDLGIWTVALRDGWAPQKLRASIDAVARRRGWRTQRAVVDAHRQLGDAAMLATLETRVSTVDQIGAPSGVRIVDVILGGFLRLVLPLVRMLDRPF